MTAVTDVVPDPPLRTGPANDPWSNFGRTPGRSASRAKNILPSDTQDLENVCEFLMVCSDSSNRYIRILPADSDDPVTITVSGNMIIPIRTRRVYKTGTCSIYRNLFTPSHEGYGLNIPHPFQIIGCW